MRKIYVPIWNTNISDKDREAYLEELQRLGANTVFFALDRCCLFERNYHGEMDLLRQNLRYFRERGFEVGAWIQGFGFGIPIPDGYAVHAARYTKIRTVMGVDAAGDALCPLNEAFAEDFAVLLGDVAATGTDLIMIDDDMCLSVRPGLGCFCDAHISLLEKELGESLSGHDLSQLFFTGGANKYRSAWLRVMDETHSQFCRMARRAVDAVSPHIRLGFAAGYSSWDIEGADALKLSRILAGDNKPFLRLTGAPYWMARNINRFDGQQLASAIEIARIQEAWSRDSSVEIFSECDSYPRPRYHVPSSILECFDLGTAASGGMGVLKYFFDYRSTFGYERGYARHHLQNSPLYEGIAAHFDGKQAFGVRVYETMRKIEKADLPLDFMGEKPIMRCFFSPAASMLGLLSIPAQHGGEAACGMAFGENVRTLDQMPRRMIIDLSAAEILAQRGVDLGIEQMQPTQPLVYELCGDEKIEIFRSQGRFAKVQLHPRAVPVTEFSDGDARFPASFRYDNGSTEFFVLAFDAYSVKQNSALFQSYLRQRTLLDFVGPVPHIANNPCVWTIAKRGAGETAILCLNIFEDPLIDAALELDRAYSSVKLIGAEGVLDGTAVRLTAPVPPYGAFIAVLKD